ncbi:hypothetical protein MXB_2814 [Myxobolus squamalis]|nr:hypothetical protein MXB_2814 [Myxobolus squamalis]
MNVFENTDLQLSGSIVQKRRLEQSIGNKRFPMMESCVIFSGLIRRVECNYFMSETIRDWGTSPRGAGYLFGNDVTQAFNQTNGIDFIARAHQLVMEGYKWHFNNLCLTVWSAPNYCYRCGNVAAILKIAEDFSNNFIVFESRYDLTRRPKRILLKA